ELCLEPFRDLMEMAFHPLLLALCALACLLGLFDTMLHH
ncbi:MAG: hypothetical protein RI931_586, partial [Actinomycetota bacterium]